MFSAAGGFCPFRTPPLPSRHGTLVVSSAFPLSHSPARPSPPPASANHCRPEKDCAVRIFDANFQRILGNKIVSQSLLYPFSSKTDISPTISIPFFVPFKGFLVELCFGSAIRNRMTRALSSLCFPPLPRWLFRWAYRIHWCDVKNMRIGGVRCRVYLPLGKAKRVDAGIVYIHGGGWCIGRPSEQNY